MEASIQDTTRNVTHALGIRSTVGGVVARAEVIPPGIGRHPLWTILLLAFKFVRALQYPAVSFLARSVTLSRAILLVLVFLSVPAVTRAAQALDPDGRFHQPSGFSHSATSPLDPVSAPANVPSVVTVVAVLVLPAHEWVGSSDDPLPPLSPTVNIRSLRAPPAALFA